MMVFAVLVALALEYYSPRPYPSPVHGPLVRYNDWILEHFNAGTRDHGWLAWGMGALLPAALAGLVGLLLDEALLLLGWAWSVVVLYVCMGYRQLADRCRDIAKSLDAGDTERARKLLAGCWRGTAGALSPTDLATVAIETLLRTALTRLFGVIFWFVLLGPFGAALYFFSQLAHGRWEGDEDFLSPLEQVVHVLDWLPARALGLSFAIVGNFESAMKSWRDQAFQWLNRNEGVALAAGAGALGIRLGGSLTLPNGELLRAELGSGAVPTPEYIQGALNLVIRVILLWLAALLIFWLGWASG
jgi:adenosylcobinamide-phosphate synthase